MFNSTLIKTAWKIRKEVSEALKCNLMEVLWKECIEMAKEAIKEASKKYSTGKFYASMTSKKFKNFSIKQATHFAFANSNKRPASLNDWLLVESGFRPPQNYMEKKGASEQ